MEEGVEKVFPAVVGDGPVDTGFALSREVMMPDVTVAFVVSDVEAIDDGHAASEFGLRFDVEEVIGVRSDERGIDGDGHGDGVGERKTVFAGLFVKSGDGARVALNGKGGNRIFGGKDLLNLDRREHGGAAAEMPTD